MAFVTSSVCFPGLHCQPTCADLEDSRDTYNNLIDSEELSSEISNTHLQGLAELFVKFNVHDRLGVHLIHRHGEVDFGHVMLGQHFTEPFGCWTKPTPLKHIDLENVHGHIFAFAKDNRFIAYEYTEGRATNFSSISSDFFKEFAAYVHENKLEETVGLQIRDLDTGCDTKKAVELDFGQSGTVMLNADNTLHGEAFRTTGWVFDCDGGIASFKSRETHAPTTKGPHKVFIDGKLVPDIEAIKDILRRHKAIR